MQENKLFDNKEIRSLFLGALVLGFIFSFRQWGYGEVNLSIGLTNLLRTTILSLIVLLIYQTAHKLAANKFGAKSTFRIWSIKRFWFTASSKIGNIKFFRKSFKTIKMGVIIPVLLALLFNGYIKFAAVGSSEITEITKKRLGKKYRHISELEIAKIHLAGPLACLLLALILTQFTGFNRLVQISYMVAIFSMIPFSGLDGAKIFFSSLGLYVLGIVFIGAAIIFMQFLPLIWTIILSIITALILLTFTLHKNT